LNLISTSLCYPKLVSQWKKDKKEKKARGKNLKKLKIIKAKSMKTKKEVAEPHLAKTGAECVSDCNQQHLMKGNSQMSWISTSR
jgi:hypothetical protein